MIANENNRIIKIKITLCKMEELYCELLSRTGSAIMLQDMIINTAITRFLLRLFDDFSDLSQQDLQTNTLREIFL
ncbi:MAG: hypothetical protein IM585_02130 [Pseudanabaena sp. M135S2SP2A07QC]|jgi:hypothetical protein|uniref:hypothetical protein n=1 Tax=Microcystis sp. M080S2 TaxID=2771175 RepID=UPI00258D57D1|nr:hypothetical protein [Microcystis sp. M080S2]MCA6502793.1 hypothetical protein [Pseudanabaena sp. M090S1SP2A07QC]MCA6507637.1 hypothetical protein [Pseudanabaena sp. M172S2SP2A07QC]MCA6520659.1 hypothetical protein [Pseudanabaena sp. M051S1SP2A07QC]MCA6526620.1 hypothetical protein [Pseudanabaena sp. M179S2SP2A07QC]MCA6529899.1 hypothetical protein [Pseudanabaena sp. M125S2SP2A07QC]MCA6532686.1 hypothetical protein [Pseudanabaena sp. M176S2SP2A07QC]MCA6539886.1 hypothetical protein [Pseud